MWSTCMLTVEQLGLIMQACNTSSEGRGKRIANLRQLGLHSKLQPCSKKKKKSSAKLFSSPTLPQNSEIICIIFDLSRKGWNIKLKLYKCARKWERIWMCHLVTIRVTGWGWGSEGLGGHQPPWGLPMFSPLPPPLGFSHMSAPLLVYVNCTKHWVSVYCLM